MRQLFLAATILILPNVALAYKYETACSGAAYYLSGNLQMRPRCAGGSTSDLISGSAATEQGWSFWLWQVLNTSAPQIYSSGPCVNNSLGTAEDGTNLLFLDSGAASAGRSHIYLDCGFFGGSDPRVKELDIEVNSSAPISHAACETALLTQAGTWSHEAGHGYGQDHFNDWLSTMNSSQPDVTSCRDDRHVRPSSDAQQGQKNHYHQGLGAAVDLGGTALIVPAGCALSGSSCATTNQFLTTVNSLPAPGNTTTQIKFTSMNMRDSTPDGQVHMRILLSKDNIADNSDVWVYTGDLTPGFGGAIYPYSIPITVNASSLQINQKYCALIQWDWAGNVSEADESDNVTPTSQCFIRFN